MTTSDLRCPRDGATLETKRYEAKIEVDSCPTCQGTWLDKGELEAIESAAENVYRGEPEALPGTADLAAQAARGPIACPKCGGETTTREHGFASMVIVDVCVAGCGVWLDGGELQSLERFYEENRGNETLPLHWRLWASVVSTFKRS